MKNKKLIIAFTIFLIVFLQVTTYAQIVSSPAKRSGPLPAPSVEGLDEYQKQIVFAIKNIEAGDYDTAMENLKSAEKLRKNAPMLYEMFGIVYDADRQSDKAFGYFIKAGEMYFKSGNMDKAWKMLGWMRTIDMHSSKVKNFEKKLRERQEVIYKERLN
ncbi:MAG: hypothetical protein V3R54_05870 [Thermodesulfovibrionia bacterium]